MSQLLNNALPQFVLREDDSSCLSEMYRGNLGVALSGPATFPDVADYSSPWWPGGGFLGARAADVCIHAEAAWGLFDSPGGAKGRLGVVGVTRDAYGTPLGSVTCKMFRTSNDELTASVVSDAASGQYFATTPYADAHYVVFFAPAGLTGATVNTLLPQ